jgi:vacuolar-type H+-ATPase subunit I/STV1
MELLAKAKLVSLSEEERAQLAAGDLTAEAVLPLESVVPDPAPGPEADTVTAAEEEPPAAAAEDLQVLEGKPLEEIFAEAGVPESPFPAERFLRLLDGLRAMDAQTRRLAVMAMDSADDNWQVADSVLDAERRIAVLDAYKQRIDAQVAGTEQQTAAQIEELKAAQARSAEAVRRQIAELEQLLERQVRSSAQQIAALEETLRATRDAAGREARRVDQEIERLSEIPGQFGQPPAASQ